MPRGELPPTGRAVTIDLCEVLEVGDDGLILHDRSYRDVAGFL